MKTLFQICTGFVTFGEDVPPYNASIKPREYIQELKKLSIPFPFYFCSHKGVQVACKETLTEFLTDSGICYTFNIIDSSDLFRDDM